MRIFVGMHPAQFHTMTTRFTGSSFLTASVLAIGFGLFGMTGCAAETTEEVETSTENMEIESKDFKPVRAPAGMPNVWKQPASKGWLGERGMCGPASLANTLRLLRIEKSPDQVYNEGANSIVGTTPRKMEAYMDAHYPNLKCESRSVDDGKTLLLDALRKKQIVNVLLSGLDGYGMHWVTVVGARNPTTDTVFTIDLGQVLRG
jgi:hypothetical protein